MSLKYPDFSLPRFHLENGYWCPTLDISNFITTGPNSGADGVFWDEEVLHRFLFIGSEARLWMAWMEFLSNYEFMAMLAEGIRLQKKGVDFTFHVPLERDLQNKDILIDLKKRIENLLAACSTICLLQKVCEPIVESVTLWFLIKKYKSVPAYRSQINEIIQKKIERYKLETIYPKVERLLENVENNFYNILSYVFSFVMDNRRECFPPLLLSASYEDFNERNCKEISERFSEVLDLFGRTSFDHEQLSVFYGQNAKQLAYPCKLSTQLRAACIALDHLPKYNHSVADAQDLIYQISVPVFTAESFVKEALSEELREIGFHPVFGSGLPPLFSVEDLKTNNEVIHQFTNVTTRKHVAIEGIIKAYGVTVLKYFFLTGKWTNLMPSTGTDPEQLKEVLKLIQFKLVEN